MPLTPRPSLPPVRSEVYDLLSPGFTGRCTAPLLVDREARKAVCNESAIPPRNLLALARPPAGAPPGTPAAHLLPAALLPQIDAWNARIYDSVNNGEAGGGEACSAPILPSTAAAEASSGRRARSSRLSTARRTIQQGTNSARPPPPVPPPAQESTSAGSARGRRGLRPPRRRCSTLWTSWRRC